MFTAIVHRSPSIPLTARLSACELFGIDAFLEEDLGYAPS